MRPVGVVDSPDADADADAAVCVRSAAAARAGCVESLGEQGCEIGRDQFGQFLGGRERRVRRGVVVTDPGHQLAEPLLAFRGVLHVDQLGHVARGEPVLVLEARDLLAGRDPAVLLPVDADEHVALLQVGAVQLRGGCGRAPSSNITGASCSCSIAARAARRSGSSSFRVELTKMRSRWSGVRIGASAALPVMGTPAPPDRVRGRSPRVGASVGHARGPPRTPRHHPTPGSAR